MSKRTIALVVGICVAGVLALVLVIVGVATHDEPGFENSSRRWQGVPLTVACRGYADGDRGCDVALAAMKAHNDRLGFMLFRWTTLREGAAIDIVMRAPVDVSGDSFETEGGHFRLAVNGSKYVHCDVWTRNAQAVGGVERMVVMHELGHCVGLAHDPYRASIMYPSQRPLSDGAMPPWISDHDRELLREVYRR